MNDQAMDAAFVAAQDEAWNEFTQIVEQILPPNGNVRLMSAFFLTIASDYDLPADDAAMMFRTCAEVYAKNIDAHRAKKAALQGDVHE